MPMSREEHEARIIELQNPDLETSRRVEVLSELRADYVGVHTDFGALETKNKKFEKDNNDLLLSNSQLFRQAGIMGKDEKDEVIVQKEFSETVTLEQLEKR